MGRKRKVLKGVISYILALGLSVVFALYLNANVGWFMLIALTLAPVLSVFLAYLTAKTVRIKCDMKECVLSKGDKYSMTVTIANKFIFPTTPIEIYVLNGDGVKSCDKRILCSVLPLSDSRVIITFAAKICGPSYVGIEQIRVTDYLGLVSFKLKNTDYSKQQKKVSVIPNIADISIRDDRILKAMHASINSDDGEDTVETSVKTFGGFPGYDNREYVPGDPVKRINWKQSAKRNRLLVRLDDELASRAITLVLDSTFVTYGIDVSDMAFDEMRTSLADDEIVPKLAEDAVENALGIARSLILSNYTVNMYVRNKETFMCYELLDDKDVEAVRLAMADYVFLNDSPAERLSQEVIVESNGGMIVSTPGSYSDLYGYLEGKTDTSKLSVFSALEEVKREAVEDTSIVRIYKDNKKEKIKDKENVKEKLKDMAVLYSVPFILTMLLSITVFAVFDVPPWSLWTLPQIIVCVSVFALCIYTMKHKLVGGLSITVVVVVILFIFVGITGGDDEYLQWFMSGGELVDNTFSHLLSLTLVFTVFFTMVVFYYTKVYYRTSALLLVSLIPFVIYVKVIKDIHIGYVMLVICFNVFMFLVNTRKGRDKGKRIVGNYHGVLSVFFYAAVFVMAALAIPKSQDTKYYYIFEELFLGGNTTVDLPEEYKLGNEYSGNADNFNQLMDRKLYVAMDVNTDGLLYLRRQVFDYYDKEIDRWYKDDKYSDKIFGVTAWAEEKNYLCSELLADAFLIAEELSEGFLERYNLLAFKEYDITQLKKTMIIEAQNYESDTYITPLGTVKLTSNSRKEIYVSSHGIQGSDSTLLDKNVSYKVEYYDQKTIGDAWIDAGGSNFDNESALAMLKELREILVSGEEELYVKVVDAFIEELTFAFAYNRKCSENNEQISDRVRELALDITSDCEYDWEKAEAIQNYFHRSGFVYDLEYDAKDDSVEYFLFESKTGTCSDFATAYVVLARAAGLTARYVEGFVPEEEAGLRYDTEYVVRTSSSHAYPEVYIQNLGFVVYESTVPTENTGSQINGGAIMFVVTLGARMLIIFAFVSFIIILALFTSKIFIPVIREKRFMRRVNKALPRDGVVMLYARLLSRYPLPQVDNAAVNTPFEYAEAFKKATEYGIGVLCRMVEMAVYENAPLSDEDKRQAIVVYRNAKKALKKVSKASQPTSAKV